jgi:imidazolonepropionase
MIAAGLPLALATDYKIGSTPIRKHEFCCGNSLHIKIENDDPEEAINAATINGAYYAVDYFKHSWKYNYW